jgi:cytochrome c-type biogenesis protein CcmH
VTLWIVFAGITLCVTAALLVPLLRRPTAEVARGNERSVRALDVFRDQLAELDGDMARGEITPDEAASARIEIERRLLTLADTADGQRSPSPSRGRLRLATAFTVALFVPLVAGLLYFQLGSPGAPDAPAAGRGTGPATAQTGDLDSAIARLVERLATNPDDAAGWLLLGRSYTVLGSYDDATEAYRRAAALRPDDAAVHAALGESIVYAAGGMVTPDADRAFRLAIAADQRSPGARYYLALAKAQAGAERDALDDWVALATDSPADAPWLPQLRDRIARTADRLGVDVSTLLAAPVSPRGLSQSDIEAAAGMSAADREQMIRGMVEQLAARLEQNPNDPDGWRRLARSYEVLGEADRADEARRRAEAAESGRSGAVSPPASPAGDQAAMIRNMVDRLARRLESDPGDAAGWTRLARSYGVLGETDRAVEAWRRASALAPTDLQNIVGLAVALVEQSGPESPVPAEAAEGFRRALAIDPANHDALYFSGLVLAQSGNRVEALARWSRLLELLDPDSEAYALVKEQADDLRAAR